MFISNLNFKKYQYDRLQDKDFTFGRRNPKLTKATTDVVVNTSKKAVDALLLSITAFAALYGITPYKVKEAAKNGELDMQGKKVDAEGANTKEYLQKRETYKQLLVTKTSFIQEKLKFIIL